MAVSITSLISFYKDDKKSVDRGEKHYKSGHVQQCSLDEGVLTGAVRASMRDTVYRVSVSTGEEGILSTKCECPRGEWKCSHAAALAIFAIHNFPCQWKKPKTAKRTQSVEELFPPTNNSFNPLTREPTSEDRDWLRDRLGGRFSGISWLLSPEPEEEHLAK